MENKRLYLVSVAIVMPVAATNRFEAETIAQQHVREEMTLTSELDYEYDAILVTELDQLPEGWDITTPHGDSRTCEELLAAMKTATE